MDRNEGVTVVSGVVDLDVVFSHTDNNNTDENIETKTPLTNDQMDMTSSTVPLTPRPRTLRHSYAISDVETQILELTTTDKHEEFTRSLLHQSTISSSPNLEVSSIISHPSSIALPPILTPTTRDDSIRYSELRKSSELTTSGDQEGSTGILSLANPKGTSCSTSTGRRKQHSHLISSHSHGSSSISSLERSRSSISIGSATCIANDLGLNIAIPKIDNSVFDSQISISNTLVPRDNNDVLESEIDEDDSNDEEEEEEEDNEVVFSNCVFWFFGNNTNKPKKKEKEKKKIKEKKKRKNKCKGNNTSVLGLSTRCLIQDPSADSTSSIDDITDREHDDIKKIIRRHRLLMSA